MKQPRFIPLAPREVLTDDQVRERAHAFFEQMQRRRTVREFSPRAVPREVIEDCLRVAGSAPSGANLQPWHFVAIGDPAVKHEIRVAAEEEEREFYEHRAPKEWLEALAPLGTDSRKPFLEIAPWL
ncbi:MAG: nitroreductase family protein, partial [Chthoniobacterales bacterium]